MFTGGTGFCPSQIARIPADFDHFFRVKVLFLDVLVLMKSVNLGTSQALGDLELS